MEKKTEKKTGLRVYCVLFFVLLWIPLLGMFFYRDREVNKKAAEASFPQARMADGSWNVEFLPQLGDYFADHFALRWEIIEADSWIKGKVFGMSGDDGVIQGRDGYYFYTESLDDYLGKTSMDERELYGTARVLALIQEYVEDQGGSFVFTVAPNKSTLYPQYMPYYHRKIQEEGNLERIVEQLERAGVAYVDLKNAFDQEEEVLYHRLDSHWNNKGAALAMSTILDALGREHTEYGKIPYEIRRDFDGDLYDMVFPLGHGKDENVYYEKEDAFSYGEGFKDTEDVQIQTTNPDREGGVVMFRDSFGNSLTPFVAEEYGRGYFDRTVPYPVDALTKEDADALIFEIVERHLDILAKEAPRMPAPVRDYQEWGQEEIAGVTMEVEDADPYTKVTGAIPGEDLDVDSEIYIRCVSTKETVVYEAAPLNEDPQEPGMYGYGLYIPGEGLEPGTYIMETLYKKEGAWVTSGYLQSITI